LGRLRAAGQRLPPPETLWPGAETGVPELPAGYNLSRCVENFGCDACFRHNRELLFDDARHRSREEIAAAKAEEEEKRHE